MTQTITRSDFLRLNLGGKNRPIRPPWAISETLFLNQCDQCGACIGDCPTNILVSARGRYPSVDFSRGECLFCGRCAAQCQTGALQQHDNDSAWSLRAVIDIERCLAFKSVECRSCSDPCQFGAISLTHRSASLALPSVDPNQCNGCGACFSICPVDAIDMQTETETYA